MPTEYIKDPRTGKWVARGSLGQGQAVVPVQPPRPVRKPKPKPRSRPQGFRLWGQSGGGFSLNQLANDLRYEANQLTSNPLGSTARATTAATRLTAGPVAAEVTKQVLLGGVQSGANAGRSLIELKQRAGGTKQTDYTASPRGRELDRRVDKVYQAVGATPPSEMTPQEKSIDDLRSSLATSAVGSVAVAAGLPMLAGVRFAGPLAQGLQKAMNPALATTWQGAVGRTVLDATVGEAVTTPIDYTATGGSALGLVDVVLGTQLDPVKPGMAFPDAAAASFIPNVAAGTLLGSTFIAIGRARSGSRAVQPIESARAELEATGLTKVDPDTGAAAFAPEPPQTLRQANAELEQKYGIARPEPAEEPAPTPPPAPVADGQPAPIKVENDDGFDIDYDPELPEADVALDLIRNASNDELLEATRSGGPVLDTLDELVSTRPPVEPDPALSIDAIGVPSDRLAKPITPYMDQWKRVAQKEPQRILAVMHPEVNPGLAARAKALTGRDWEQLTALDGVAVLEAAANDGVTVVPNRLLAGQQFKSTDELVVAPQILQYKPGVDARGVQTGSSLEGVDLWNTDMEGTLEIWQNPKDAKYYVVNGHNRFAMAQELGIKTVPVKEIIADTPEQAKTIGALSNIASGGGTPLDAARFMKGLDIKDPAQLESLGVPLSPTSGHGLSGFQLSQLPDDVLRAVESGQVKMRQGQIIGGSGADEESMRAAYRYLVENPGTTEGRLRNMLEMSKQMSGGGAAARTEQGDLLTGTDWDQTFNRQMIAVADLADEVSTLLKREKKLFRMADAQSATLEAGGSRINKVNAQQIADANARAIDYFQRTWMETGPIRDLLNEGGTRVAGGENKAAIARQIKNRLVSQLGDLMGEEAVVRTDVVQEDLLAQAPQQLDELLPEDRQAMEMLAIQRAIDNGEVRPPETPIPSLPGDSGVDLLKVQRDLEANTITDDVVTALGDELELRDAYKQIDEATARAEEAARREATGYELKSFDEKKAEGLLDGFEDQSLAGFDGGAPDPLLRAARKRELMDVIESVVGKEAKVRFQDLYERKIKSKEWGGDGVEKTNIGGWYRFEEDLMQINGVLQQPNMRPLVEAAYHESWHRLQYFALGKKDAQVLNSAFARVKIAYGGATAGASKSYSESQGVAFQRYAAAKRAGEDPVRAIFGGYDEGANALTKAQATVASFFDRILDVFEKLFNGVTIGRFDSTKAIFERAYRGALIEAQDFAFDQVGSGMDRMIAGNWRTRTWAFGEKGRTGNISDWLGLNSEMPTPSVSPGSLVDDFSVVLGDIDPKTGFPKGISRAAAKAALQGSPDNALAESVQLAETRLTDLNARIEAVKQRAAQEGC